MELHMNKAISKTTGAAIIEFIGAQTTAYGKLTAVLDLLIADGHTDLLAYRAPEKGEDRTFYDSLVNYVVKGLPANEQALLARDTKALTTEQKAEKRAVGMKKGALVGNIRNAMTNRLQRNEDKGATTPVAPETKILEDLARASKRAEKLEAPRFDIVSFNKKMNELLKILAGK